MPSVPTFHSRTGLSLRVSAIAVGNPDIEIDLLIGDIYEALDKIQGVQVQGVETVPTMLQVDAWSRDHSPKENDHA